MKKLLLALLVLMLPALALAADISSGETVSIEHTQKNPIIFSTTANIKSDVEGDLTVFAQDITVDNPVSGSAYLFGKNVNVNSSIGNRLIVAAAKVTVSSEVKGDLIVASGDITLESSSQINGDVFAYGSAVDIKGKIDGQLKTGGSKVSIDGAVVQKDALVGSNQITLADNSQIVGNMTYKSTNEMSFPQNVVKGKILFDKVKQGKSLSVYSVIGGMSMLIIAGLLLVWLMRSNIESAVSAASQKFGTVWLTGFLVTIIAPLAMMVLIVSYIGIYSFIVLAVLYALAFILGYVYGAIFIGHVVVNLLTKAKSQRIEWSAIIIGPIILILIGLIPVIGGLAKYVLTILGFGMFIMQLKVFKTQTK